MQLGMLWVFGFVRLAAGPIRAASECTGVLRKSGMQLGMLWISGVREPQIRRGGALRKLRRATRGSRGEEGRPPEQVMGDNESQ